MATQTTPSNARTSLTNRFEPLMVTLRKSSPPALSKIELPVETKPDVLTEVV